MTFDVTHWFASLQCQAMKFHLPAEFLGTNMAAKTRSFWYNISENALQTY